MIRHPHHAARALVLTIAAICLAPPAGAATVVKKLDVAAANEARELTITIKAAENHRDAYLRLLAAPGDANARKAQADGLDAAVTELTRLNDLVDQLIRRQSLVAPKFTIRSDMRLMQVGNGWAVAFEPVP